MQGKLPLKSLPETSNIAEALRQKGQCGVHLKKKTSPPPNYAHCTSETSILRLCLHHFIDFLNISIPHSRNFFKPADFKALKFYTQILIILRQIYPHEENACKITLWHQQLIRGMTMSSKYFNSKKLFLSTYIKNIRKYVLHNSKSYNS